jgi:hypothetical protein
LKGCFEIALLWDISRRKGGRDRRRERERERERRGRRKVKRVGYVPALL